MTLEFKPMSQIPIPHWLELLNHPLVKRHMPLATDDFTALSCQSWIESKELLWQTHGYGPQAISHRGEFVGWGGFQPDGDDIDLGLVLHPQHWGLGIAIFRAFLHQGFETHHFRSVVIALPESRTRTRALSRAGFRRDGDYDVGGVLFHRWRLENPKAGDSSHISSDRSGTIPTLVNISHQETS